MTHLFYILVMTKCPFRIRFNHRHAQIYLKIKNYASFNVKPFFTCRNLHTVKDLQPLADERVENAIHLRIIQENNCQIAMPQHDDPFNANCIQTTKIVSSSNVDAQPVGTAVQTLENIQPRQAHQSDYIKNTSERQNQNSDVEVDT